MTAALHPESNLVMGVAGGIPQHSENKRSHVNTITLPESDGLDFILDFFDLDDVLLDIRDRS